MRLAVRARRLSLRTALMLSAGAMLVAVLGAFAVPLSFSMAHHTLDEARSQELADASRLASRISDAVAIASNASVERPQTGVSLAVESRDTAARGLRVIVVDQTRRVLYDSRGKRVVGAIAPDPNGDFAGALAHPSRFGSEAVVQRRDDLVLTLPVFEAGDIVGAVQVERPLSSVQASTRRANLELAGFALLALILGLVVAGSLATLVTRPVRRLEDVATRLGAGDLEARATPEGARELAGLAYSFNSMAADLVSNLRAQQDFAANASHQLKTPLTALQLRLEAIAAGPANGVDAQTEARHALDDVGRLIGLMHDLLSLARVSAPVRGGEAVDLGELASTVVDRWSETAARHGKQLFLQVHGEETVTADPHDLEDLLDNLIDNAIRYSDGEPRIEISVRAATMSVQNAGLPIPPDEREQIFERFFRGHEGRRVSPGTGLGLAIVDALARRWGAHVVLVDGPLTRFEVRFPSRTAAPPPRSRGTRSKPGDGTVATPET
jgi:two-component system, OmpR family, sensor kinase